MKGEGGGGGGGLTTAAAGRGVWGRMQGVRFRVCGLTVGGAPCIA